MRRNRWDSRRLEDRIAAEASFHQIDLSKYVTLQEALRILGVTHETVRYRFDWLCGITLCGRKFVKRDRTEWLRKFRNGELTSDDQMGESLAPFDVRTAREETERRKREKEEKKRLEAEANRPKGFHVERGYWWDYDNNDTWVNTRQAAINLDIIQKNVHNLADRGVIRRRWADQRTYEPVHPPRDSSYEESTSRTPPESGGEAGFVGLPGKAGRPKPSMCGYRAMFSLRDIEAYIERRNTRGRRRPVSFNDPDRPFTPVRTYPMERSAHESCIIPRSRVARILGVTLPHVSNLVSRGKLKCYSERPGRQGVQTWFSQAEVLAYAKSERRVKFRACYDKYVNEKKAGTWVRNHPPYQPAFGMDYLYETNRNLRKSYGEFYTVRQAAEILGCSTRNVRHKIITGALKAIRKNRALHNEKWNTRRWWFIKKEICTTTMAAANSASATGHT